MANNTAEEYEQLKKRNRRRLIGTVILVFIVFIVLWKAFSQKPAPVGTEQEVLIDRGEASTPYTTDRPPLEIMPANASDMMDGGEILASGESIDLPDIPTTVPAIPASEVTPRPNERPDPPVVTPPKDKPPIDKPKPVDKPPKEPKVPKDKRPNPQDILDGKVPGMTAPPAKVSSKYVIQVAALSNLKQAQELKERLNGIGISASVSTAKTSKGEVSRVRVGPFVDKAEAEKTLSRLKSSDINGIIVQQ